MAKTYKDRRSRGISIRIEDSLDRFIDRFLSGISVGRDKDRDPSRS